MGEQKNGRRRGIALLLVGMVLGAALISPAGAHIGSVKHTWREHFLPLAKKAFYTKKQSNERFLGNVRARGTGGDTGVAITGDLFGGSGVELNELGVNAPKTGSLAVNWSAWLDCDSDGALHELGLIVDGAALDTANVWVQNCLANDWQTVTWSTLIPVAKGSHTLEVKAGNFSGSGTFADDSHLTAVFVAGSGAVSTVAPRQAVERSTPRQPGS